MSINNSQYYDLKHNFTIDHGDGEIAVDGGSSNSFPLPVADTPTVQKAGQVAHSHLNELALSVRQTILYNTPDEIKKLLFKISFTDFENLQPEAEELHLKVLKQVLTSIMPLEKCHEILSLTDDENTTPLDIAVRAGNVQLVALLARYTPLKKDIHGRTFLHHYLDGHGAVKFFELLAALPSWHKLQVSALDALLECSESSSLPLLYHTDAQELYEKQLLKPNKDVFLHYLAHEERVINFLSAKYGEEFDIQIRQKIPTSAPIAVRLKYLPWLRPSLIRDTAMHDPQHSKLIKKKVTIRNIGTWHHRECEMSRAFSAMYTYVLRDIPNTDDKSELTRVLSFKASSFIDQFSPRELAALARFRPRMMSRFLPFCNDLQCTAVVPLLDADDLREFLDTQCNTEQVKYVALATLEQKKVLADWLDLPDRQEVWKKMTTRWENDSNTHKITVETFIQETMAQLDEIGYRCVRLIHAFKLGERMTVKPWPEEDPELIQAIRVWSAAQTAPEAMRDSLTDHFMSSPMRFLTKAYMEAETEEKAKMKDELKWEEYVFDIDTILKVSLEKDAARSETEYLNPYTTVWVPHSQVVPDEKLQTSIEQWIAGWPSQLPSLINTLTAALEPSATINDNKARS